MKNTLFLLFVLFAASCSNMKSKSDRKADEYARRAEEMATMSEEEMMSMMMEMGAPGPQHADMANTLGSWNVEMKSWMSADQPEPGVTQAYANREMILGGRHLVEDYSSDFMGMPFEGRLTQGYDNLREEYWAIWIDNLSTKSYQVVGQRNEAGELHLDGMIHDMLTPDGRPSRMVISPVNNGVYTMMMFDTLPDGGEWKTMELIYTRAN